MRLNIQRTWLAIAALLVVSSPVHGFGGAIAVGMARMLGEDQQLDVSFSARGVLETEEYNVEERMFYRPGKLREEMQMAGQNMTVISRHDLGKMWMIMPQGMYMEHDVDDPGQQAKTFRMVEHEVVGEEMVNGMQTTKHKTIWETDDGRYGGFSWATDDGIVVKAFMVSETGGEKQRIRFQLTDLQRGDQPNAQFEIPDGYARMDMSGMGGMAGALGRQGQQGGQSGNGEGGFPQSLMEAAKDGAQDSAESETRNQVGRKVREGLRGLFNRD